MNEKNTDYFAKSDKFESFLNKFKDILSVTFDMPMNTRDEWFNVSGTCGWHTALKLASKEHMPEVVDLWDELVWWASDKFDSWLIDCAEWAWVIESDDKYALGGETIEEVEDDELPIGGDIYLNPAFGDMWIVDGSEFVKINDGLRIDLDEPVGFIKVGHVDGVVNKDRGDILEDNPHVDDHNP